jgi:Tol biopolymer transport system component
MRHCLPVALVTLACVGVGPALAQTSEIPMGEIVYTSEFEGNTDIYRIAPDGKDIHRLTASNGIDSNPVWSPDGSKVAFQSNRDGDFEIFIMNPDGSDEQQITNNDSDDYQPTWSPDGQKLAFSSGPVGGAANTEFSRLIYVIDLDGGNLRQITPDAANIQDFYPRWSPDGEWIVFSSNRAVKGATDSYLYLIRPNGDDLQRLGEGENDIQPSWSPDGRFIVFASERDDNFNIYVHDLETGVQERLTDDPKSELTPVFSPDGSQIGYSSNRSGIFQLYRMDSDGGGIEQLTTHGDSNTAPNCKW